MLAPTLCIDTCGPSLLLAIGGSDADGDPVDDMAVHFEAMPTGQAEALLPALQALMARAGFEPRQHFEKIVVTIGPGSFTGLRVGLAVAKARALADHCLVVPVNRLQLIALCAQRSAEQHSSVAVAVDARRGEHYVQAFSAALDPQSEPMTLANADVPAWLGAQDTGLKAADGGEAFGGALLARAMGHLASAQPPLQHRDLRPLYVRPPDAKPPKGTRFTLT